ncbi:unnamed protein product [Heligmosomoides polygyrus]|uniref:Cytochrome b5 n=1 Tax=Heligmosomoides polygyrus TaxID=6339 RepID=A0A183F1Y5_HELPZ|nr:unnamed protein product [Heligmosomoides polygyrus]
MAETFTLEDVAAHNSEDSAWLVIRGKVYDVTKFLDDHPGGSDVLLEQVGKDATEAFDDIGHSSDAKEMMEEYYIGDVVKVGSSENIMIQICALH